jgi:hypothetical protein
MSMFDGIPVYNMLQLKKRTLLNFKLEVDLKIRELESLNRGKWEEANDDVERALSKGYILACMWIMDEMNNVFQDITRDVREED